jgi:lysyl-tRNA synthetase class 2
MREFLIEKGFLEVETPVLENTAGGADANPFITHHNALDIDLYLRISMGELWQKRLMVAGFGKTFEIGRQFRNEGLDREHLQDYTQMEFYWGYANYEDSMKLVEEMYKYVAKKTFGTLQFEIGEHKVNFDREWEKIDYRETLLKETGIDISKASEEELKKALTERKVEYNKSDEKGRLIDSLWKTVRKSISGPVFLTGHPVEVSPLAKRMEASPEFVERYQVIIAGSENGNGYSELNDPIDQAKRFAAQEKMREKGDTEAQMEDNDFVRALEYGMPPTSGFGVSERLFSFLVGKSIRETVLFPLLRPEVGKKVNTE